MNLPFLKKGLEQAESPSSDHIYKSLIIISLEGLGLSGGGRPPRRIGRVVKVKRRLGRILSWSLYPRRAGYAGEG